MIRMTCILSELNARRGSVSFYRTTCLSSTEQSGVKRMALTIEAGLIFMRVKGYVRF